MGPARWQFWKRSATPVEAPALPDPRSLSIRQGALDALRARTQSVAKLTQDAFRPYTPAPGVLPEGVSTSTVFAQDSVFGAVQSWGWQDGFAGREGMMFPGFAFLSELAQRPEYRMMTETYAREMTRKWIRLFGRDEDADVSDKIAELEAEAERFHLRRKFRQMAEMDGFFGRGQLFLDFGHQLNDPELALPLVPDKRKIKRGSLKGFNPVEPLWSYPATFEAINPLTPRFYQPDGWYVMGHKVHPSRLLTFVSREVPNILKAAYAFSGLSLSQMAMPYVQNFIRTRQSVSDLVNAFSIMVLATDMSTVLNQGGADELARRAEMFSLFRDNFGLFEIDKEREEFANVSAPIAGLHELQAQSQEQMASVSGIPLVKLLGTTPSGLNASSDGEIRVFYDRVHALQEHLFADHLGYCLRLLQINLWGEIDESIGWEFEPLWQMDEAAEAVIAKTQADRDAVYVDSGVLSPEEIRTRLARDPKSGYQGLDVDDVPDAQPDTEDHPDINGDPAKSAEPRSEERSGV